MTVVHRNCELHVTTQAVVGWPGKDPSGIASQTLLSSPHGETMKRPDQIKQDLVVDKVLAGSEALALNNSVKACCKVTLVPLALHMSACVLVSAHACPQS